MVHQYHFSSSYFADARQAHMTFNILRSDLIVNFVGWDLIWNMNFFIIKITSC